MLNAKLIKLLLSDRNVYFQIFNYLVWRRNSKSNLEKIQLENRKLTVKKSLTYYFNLGKMPIALNIHNDAKTCCLTIKI